MTALLVIAIILAIILFLLSLRATITVTYSEELAVSVRILCFRIRLLPKKKKKGPYSMSARKARKIREKYDKKKAKKAQKARDKKREKEERKKEKKSGSGALSVLRLVTAILKKVLGKFFKHVRVDLKRLRVTVATSDAATTAIAYGAVTATVSTLIALIESAKHYSLPNPKDLDVGVDFLSDTPKLDLNLSVSLRVWHVLDIALGALLTLVKHKMKNELPEAENEDHKFPPKH